MEKALNGMQTTQAMQHPKDMHFAKPPMALMALMHGSTAPPPSLTPPTLTFVVTPPTHFSSLAMTTPLTNFVTENADKRETVQQISATKVGAYMLPVI